MLAIRYHVYSWMFHKQDSVHVWTRVQVMLHTIVFSHIFSLLSSYSLSLFLPLPPPPLFRPVLGNGLLLPPLGPRRPQRLRVATLQPVDPLDALPPAYLARRKAYRPMATALLLTSPNTSTTPTATVMSARMATARLHASSIYAPFPSAPHPLVPNNIRPPLLTTPSIHHASIPAPFHPATPLSIRPLSPAPTRFGRARQRSTPPTVSRAPRGIRHAPYPVLRPTIANDASSPPTREDGSIDVWEVIRARHRPSTTPPLWQHWDVPRPFSSSLLFMLLHNYPPL